MVVDHELFYHDTFSAYPVCFSSSRIWLVLENLGVETLAIKFDL